MSSFYPLDPETTTQKLRGSNGGSVARGFVAVVSITPVVEANTGLLAATTLADGATTAVVDADITDPDVPRTLRFVVNQVSVTGNVVITGLDSNNQAITETLALNGTTPVNSVKAFKRVTALTLPARNAGGDSVTMGPGPKIGLYHKLPSTDHVILKVFDGSTDAGTVTVDGTDVCKNLYDPAGTLNGTKRLILAYLTHA